jgi:hypothetical protein
MIFRLSTSMAKIIAQLERPGKKSATNSPAE